MCAISYMYWLPWWLSGKEPACQCRKHRFNPWVRKVPCRWKWQPTPLFLPVKTHGQRSLWSYNPWDHKRIGHNLLTKQQQQKILLVTQLMIDKYPSTMGKSYQSILMEINPEFSLEGLMLKLNLQYFGRLMQKAYSLEKTVMLGEIEGRRRREQQRMRAT